MNEQQYQQPQYQQPQYQQPQQPQYQQAPYGYAPRPAGQGANGIVEFVAKILPVLTLVFICLAGVGFLYHFILSIVDSSKDYVTDSFRVFASGFATTISVTAKYLFYAALTTVGAKLLKK